MREYNPNALLFVIAGNMNEAKDFAKFKNIPWPEVRYITSAESLLGIAHAEYVEIGTYYRRRDLEKIRYMLHVSFCKQITTAPHDLLKWVSKQRGVK